MVVWSQNLSFFLFRISSQILRFSPKLRYLSIFLFRISSQNWRFSQKLRFSFLKGFQAKKGLVLHVLCPSHPCASLARTVLKPLSFFCEVKVKWKKSDHKKVLWFSWNLYISYIMYIPLINYEQKYAGHLSYGFNISDKLEGCTHEKKIPYGDLNFSF